MSTTTRAPSQTEQRTGRSSRRMPGPPWVTVFGSTVRVMRDALAFTTELRERYGDYVTIPTLVGPAIMVYSPDGVRRILQENHLNYNKDIPDYHVLSLLTGKGLVTNDGASWLQQRRLIQPAFHRERIAGFGALMAEAAEAQIAGWDAHGLIDSGTPFDILHEMSTLTLRIVCQALFGQDLPADEQARVAHAFTEANHLLSQAFYLPGLLTLPTPQRRRMLADRRELHAVVEGIIRRRREHPEQRGDLLALLLDAQDAETGKGMSDEQARDEVLTLLLAGHETTANALAWTFYLLAQHPEVTDDLRAEYRAVLDGRLPQMDDLPNLPKTRMVIDESMRLYPPAWAVARHALGEDEIGGYRIPKGAYIILVNYVTHRHPDHWERPNEFDPERFSPERSAGRPRFAYSPFGGGPRLCIGNTFALSEAALILATILSKYQLRLASDAPVTSEPMVTLRPKGVLMTAHKW